MEVPEGGFPVHRATVLVFLPLFLFVAACPRQEEPVKVGTNKPKAVPVEATEKKAAPTPDPVPAQTPPADPHQDRADRGERAREGGEGLEPPEAPTAKSPAGNERSKKPPKSPRTPKPKPGAGDQPQAEEPAADAPSVEVNARALFLKKCKTCHGVDGKADTKMGAKHDIPDMTASDWDRKWPRAKVVRMITKGKSGTKMKAFEDKLSADEIAAVADFVRKF